MHRYTFQRELWIPKPLPVVFGFFSRPENLEQITPPWLRFRFLTPPPTEMRQGVTIAYGLKLRGIRLKWLTEIERWNPPYEFVDIQRKGPYSLWRHTHRFTEVDGGTRMTDVVDYALPFGLLGRLAHRLQVSRDIAAIFDYRTQRIQALLQP